MATDQGRKGADVNHARTPSVPLRCSPWPDRGSTADPVAPRVRRERTTMEASANGSSLTPRCLPWPPVVWSPTRTLARNGLRGSLPIRNDKSASRLERVHPPPGTSAVCAYSVKLTWGEALGGLATPLSNTAEQTAGAAVWLRTRHGCFGRQNRRLFGSIKCRRSSESR